MPRSSEDKFRQAPTSRPAPRPRRTQKQALDDPAVASEESIPSPEDVTQHDQRLRSNRRGLNNLAEPRESPSPSGKIVVGSPPRDRYDHMQGWPRSPSIGEERYVQNDPFSLKSSPPSYGSPIWINGSNPTEAASLAGSPPSMARNGIGPTWDSASPWARHIEQPRQQRRNDLHMIDTIDIEGKPRDAIVTATGSSIEVHSVDAGSLHPLGKLADIGADVRSAKVLPKPGGHDPLSAIRPLVALVLFGPTKAENVSADVHQPPICSTRVEVHSLKSGKSICQLYESPDVSHAWNSSSASIADIHIEAQGAFICLASSVSGELFLFTASDDNLEPREHFRCIGKFWTAVPFAGQGMYSPPLFALSSRWLCVVVPSSQLKHSIQGTVPISHSSPPPFNVESVTAPAASSVDCTLEIPDPEGFANKMAKGVAQEFFKGAQWVGNQGFQAINSYWSRSPISSSESVDDGRQSTSPFPPTHANQTSSPNERQTPSTLSIIDLEQLLHPPVKGLKKVEGFATFTLPSGCSFVSFAPSGLALFTVNANGDSQHLWSLMTTHSSSFATRKPVITELARFSRFTHTRVVAVTWSRPRGDKLAMVTERGTIHILKLRATAPWLPLAKPVKSNEGPQGKSANLPAEQSRPISSHLPLKPEGMLGSAATAIRKRSSSGVASLLGGFGGLNIKDGRRIASGMSKTATAAVVSLRQSDEVRLRLSVGPRGVSALSLKFLHDQSPTRIAAISGASLHIYDLTSESSKPSIALDINNSSHRPNTTESFWKDSMTKRAVRTNTLHPLSCAEIDTSPSLQPFFADRRFSATKYQQSSRSHPFSKDDPWSFGQDIPSVPLDTSLASSGIELPRVTRTPDRIGSTDTETTTTQRDFPVKVAPYMEAQIHNSEAEVDIPEVETLLGDLNDSALLEHINDEHDHARQAREGDNEDDDYANWDTNWNAGMPDVDSDGEMDLLR